MSISEIEYLPEDYEKKSYYSFGENKVPRDHDDIEKSYDDCDFGINNKEVEKRRRKVEDLSTKKEGGWGPLIVFTLIVITLLVFTILLGIKVINCPLALKILAPITSILGFFELVGVGFGIRHYIKQRDDDATALEIANPLEDDKESSEEIKPKGKSTDSSSKTIIFSENRDYLLKSTYAKDGFFNLTQHKSPILNPQGYWKNLSQLPLFGARNDQNTTIQNSRLLAARLPDREDGSEVYFCVFQAGSKGEIILEPMLTPNKKESKKIEYNKIEANIDGMQRITYSIRYGDRVIFLYALVIPEESNQKIEEIKIEEIFDSVESIKQAVRKNNLLDFYKTLNNKKCNSDLLSEIGKLFNSEN